MDLNENTRSSHATGIARWARDVNWDPHNVHTHTHTHTQESKNEKRGRKGKSGRGGLRPLKKEAKYLSRKHFTICSWNRASASKQGAVLERLACDWCPLPTGNEDTPRNATWTERLPGHPEAQRASSGDRNWQCTNTITNINKHYVHMISHNSQYTNTSITSINIMFTSWDCNWQYTNITSANIMFTSSVVIGNILT